MRRVVFDANDLIGIAALLALLIGIIAIASI